MIWGNREKMRGWRHEKNGGEREGDIDIKGEDREGELNHVGESNQVLF